MALECLWSGGIPTLEVLEQLTYLLFIAASSVSWNPVGAQGRLRTGSQMAAAALSRRHGTRSERPLTSGCAWEARFKQLAPPRCFELVGGACFPSCAPLAAMARLLQTTEDAAFTIPLRLLAKVSDSWMRWRLADRDTRGAIYE